MHSRPDRDLVEAVLARRPEAFERLVCEYQGLCWHIVQRMVRDPEDTRELCQDTFLRVYQCLHQYRFDSPLKSWIGRVAYTIALRHLERKRIPVAEDADEEGTPLHERVADEFDLEGTVSGDELSRHLHAAIQRLPPLQRTILTLYHLDELPLAQIARITGLAEGTLKSHLFRSRKRLQELLAPAMGVAA